MPDITNDVKPSADWLAFFTDLPVNLAKMATLRDELEKRQGAMSAVEAAAADREQAAAELAKAKAQAAEITAGADEQVRKIAADRAKLDSDYRNFKDYADARDAAAAKRELALDAREARLNVAEQNLSEQTAALEKAQAKLAADTATLEARIKTFQEKVAHLAA